MHFKKTFCNLFARSFVRNFKQVFVNEMGLKSLGPSGDSFFGIKVIKDPSYAANCYLYIIEVLEKLQEVMLDNMPASFDKQTSETIRAKCPVSRQKI